MQRVALEPPQEPLIEVRDIINMGSKPRVLVETPDTNVMLTIPVAIMESSQPHICIQTPLSPLIDASDSINAITRLSKVWWETELELEFAPPPEGSDLKGKTPSATLEPPQSPGAMLEDVANMGSRKVKQLQETMIEVVWAQHNQGVDKVVKII